MYMDIDHVDINTFPPFDHFHLKFFNKYVALSEKTEKNYLIM